MGLASPQMAQYLVVGGQCNDWMATPESVGECYACELAAGESELRVFARFLLSTHSTARSSNKKYPLLVVLSNSMALCHTAAHASERDVSAPRDVSCEAPRPCNKPRVVSMSLVKWDCTAVLSVAEAGVLDDATDGRTATNAAVLGRSFSPLRFRLRRIVPERE